MNLKSFQNHFQSYLLSDDIEMDRHILSSKKLSSSQKLTIYQNSYYERIIGAMKTDFPVMNNMLGDGAFSDLICDYIDSYPSHDYTLRYVGKNLAQFILDKDSAFLAYSDLARFEYLMCEAEHKKTKISEIDFHSPFNIVEVWNVFQTTGKLISIAFETTYLKVKA